MASPLATITPVEGVPAWRHSLTGPRVGAAEGTRRRQWPGPPRHRRGVERRLAASTPSASPSRRSARGAILALADGGTPIALVKPWAAVEADSTAKPSSFRIAINVLRVLAETHGPCRTIGSTGRVESRSQTDQAGTAPKQTPLHGPTSGWPPRSLLPQALVVVKPYDLGDLLERVGQARRQFAAEGGIKEV